MSTDDDNTDPWHEWWLTPGFPLPPGPTPPPKRTPGQRVSTDSLYPQPGTFIVHRLLKNTAASASQARRLLERLREAVAARMLLPAAIAAGDLRAELGHHRRQLDAAGLRVSADAPDYDEQVVEARADLDELVAECQPLLALAPSRAEEEDRRTWVVRIEQADQVRLASEEPACDGGQVIDAAARFAGGATSPREKATAAPRAPVVRGARKRYRLDQASFDALVGELDELDTSHIAAAVQAADFEDAAVRALARVQLGLDLPIEHVLPIVAGLVHLDVVLALLRDATGDVVGGLIELLEDGQIPPTPDGTERRAIALLALWLLGGKVRGRDTICRWVRRTLRTERTGIATDCSRPRLMTESPA